MGLFDNFMEKGKSFSDLQKYVNDFEIVEQKDEKGRVRKKAVYKGEWTVMRSPERSRWRLIASAGMAAALSAAYCRTLLVTSAVSGQILVMLPLLIGLFPLLYLLMGVLSLPYRGRPMRRDQYMHSFIRVFRSCVAVGAFDLVGLAASFIFRAVRGDWLFLPEDWGFVASCALALSLAAGILTILRGVECYEKENGAYPAQAI